ncbi:hypothetical protein GGI21_003162 [Coemansia aciculifera]|nr:hypothetical protein GGI21_003162 [Coemansia aciculifera]
MHLRGSLLAAALVLSSWHVVSGADDVFEMTKSLASGGGDSVLNIAKAADMNVNTAISSTTALSSITTTASSTSVISQPTTGGMTNNQGTFNNPLGQCSPGFTYCPNFGCLQVTQCPVVCSVRMNEPSCTGSINGQGCKWVSNTCVQDIQCPVSANGECPTGCQGCGVFQCINQGLQCPVKCPLLPQAGCGKAPITNGLGCAWVGGQCVVWDAVNGAVLGPGRLVANQYVTPVLSPSESSMLFPPSVVSSTTSSTTTTTSSYSSIYVTPTPTPIMPSSSSTSTSSTSTSSSSSESPSSTPEADAQDQAADGKGMSSSGKAAIVILMLGIAGLISWGGLYYFTRDKVNFHHPSSSQNAAADGNAQKMLPVFTGSAFYGNNGGGSSRNSHGNMSTLRGDSYIR